MGAAGWLFRSLCSSGQPGPDPAPGAGESHWRQAAAPTVKPLGTRGCGARPLQVVPAEPKHTVVGFTSGINSRLRPVRMSQSPTWIIQRVVMAIANNRTFKRAGSVILLCCRSKPWLL